MKNKKIILMSAMLVCFSSSLFAEVTDANGLPASPTESCIQVNTLNVRIGNRPWHSKVRHRMLINSLELFAQPDALVYLGKNRQEWDIVSQTQSFKKFDGDQVNEVKASCAESMIGRWWVLERMHDHNVGYNDYKEWDTAYKNSFVPYDTASYFINMVNAFFSERSEGDRVELKQAIEQELTNNPEVKQYFLDKLNLN